MFSPNTTGLLTKRLGDDKFGEPVYAAQPIVQACAVVKLEPTVTKTPIRSTASASKGEADEIVEPATILFPTSSTIAVSDKFVIYGSELRCISVQPRISVFGNLDHYECTFEVSGS